MGRDDMKSCAICGQSLDGRGGLCNSCWKEWTATGTLSYPDWLKFLVCTQRSYERQRANFEIVGTDFIETR